jgi:gamma-glutamyltranspeptidase/glutathione hydrolase
VVTGYFPTLPVLALRQIDSGHGAPYHALQPRGTYRGAEMDALLHRRDLLRFIGAGLLSLPAGGGPYSGPPKAAPPNRRRQGCVAGHPEGAQAGLEMLASGGNAVDAAVAAALVAGVVSPQMCGAGGYGGHMIIAPTGGRIVAIDFNTAAPRAATPDMFPRDDAGQVRGRSNLYGWLAAGVPGTLAGLQLALDRHGTLPFSRVVQPAIHHAREGFEVSTALATAVRSTKAQLARDTASARLLLPGGEPLQPGSRFRNPDLADLLEALAEQESVESFYRGAVARRIAAAFAAHGGLVTAEDLAAYRAREVEPLEFSWRGCSVLTAPLTAGGLTALQALAILKALRWETRDPDDPRTTHLRVEALRAAWHDRLRLLGDPEHAEVPVRRLLSAEYAGQVADRVEKAVRSGRTLPAETDGRSAGGTIHLSAGDSEGTMVALTLTHGDSFGARVTVDGLGLILGHGMSRFDPRPDHPNAPGPGKRPLHNMCPTLVQRDGRPVLALGGRGGRKIPNSVFDVLLAYVGRQAPLAKAVAAPRLHTEGGPVLTLEEGWRAEDMAYLKGVSYDVRRGAGAVVHAVAFDPASGALASAGR